MAITVGRGRSELAVPYRDPIVTKHARCWPGGANDRPDFDSAVEGEDYIEGSIPVSSEEPFGIYGEIDTSATSTYTCNWSYETELHEVETTGRVVELHNDASIEYHTPEGFQRSPSDVRQDFFNRHEGLQDSYERDNFLSQMQEWESVQNVA